MRSILREQAALTGMGGIDNGRRQLSRRQISAATLCDKRFVVPALLAAFFCALTGLYTLKNPYFMLSRTP